MNAQNWTFPRREDRRLTDVELREMALSLGWTKEQLAHAQANATTAYGEECVIEIGHLGGLELHCPAYPADMSYVRAVQGGFEIAFWSREQWQGSGAETLVDQLLVSQHIHSAQAAQAA